MPFAWMSRGSLSVGATPPSSLGPRRRRGTEAHQERRKGERGFRAYHGAMGRPLWTYLLVSAALGCGSSSGAGSPTPDGGGPNDATGDSRVDHRDGSTPRDSGGRPTDGGGYDGAGTDGSP